MEIISGKIGDVDESLKKLRRSLRVADKVEERAKNLEEMQEQLEMIRNQHEIETSEQKKNRSVPEHETITRRRW